MMDIFNKAKVAELEGQLKTQFQFSQIFVKRSNRLHGELEKANIEIETLKKELKKIKQDKINDDALRMQCGYNHLSHCR